MSSGKTPFEDLPHECTEALSAMYLYIDGEMEVEQITVVKQHIEGCVDCFEAFDFEAELKSMISKKCCETPPDGMKERIQQLITEADPIVNPTNDPLK